MKALILGGSRQVWDDAASALKLGEYEVIIAVNTIGTKWAGRIDHWVSLHAEKYPNWLKTRRLAGYNTDMALWAHKDKLFKINGEPVKLRLSKDWAGSSGLFAVKIALTELHLDKVVLAGIGLTPEPHFDRKDKWHAAHGFRKGWSRRIPDIRDQVRSMSGWTKDQLGAPTAQWLAA